jgi:hypothetical protein
VQARRIARRPRVDHQRPPAEAQRPEVLPHRDVPAEAVLLRHQVRAREAEAIVHPRDAVDDRLVTYGHALAPARRAGGEQHERVGSGVDRHAGGLGRGAPRRRHHALRRRLARQRLAQQARNTRVLDHLHRARRRLAGVERHAHAPGPEHAQHPDDALDRPPVVHADAVTRSHAGLQKRPRSAIDPPEHLTGVQRQTVAPQRLGLRRPTRRTLEQVGQRSPRHAVPQREAPRLDRVRLLGAQRRHAPAQYALQRRRGVGQTPTPERLAGLPREPKTHHPVQLQACRPAFRREQLSAEGGLGPVGTQAGTHEGRQGAIVLRGALDRQIRPPAVGPDKGDSARLEGPPQPGQGDRRRAQCRRRIVAERLARGALHRRAPFEHLEQAGAVGLARGAEREALQPRDRPWHERLGQRRTEGLPEPGPKPRPVRPIGRRDHRDQRPLPPRIGRSDGDRVEHPGLPTENGLDLRRLDPVPADLHLLVRAPGKLHHAVGAHAAPVARAIGPHAEARDRDEAPRRLRLVAQVAQRQTLAGGRKLARFAQRRKPALGIQNRHARARDRKPDRHRGLRIGLADLVARRERRVLRRAIRVDDAEAGQAGAEPRGVAGRHRLATREHDRKRLERLRPLVNHRVEQRRGQEARRHAVLPDRLADLAKPDPPRRRDHHRPAREQRGPDLQRRGVERRRGDVQEARRRIGPQEPVAQAQPDDRPVGHHNALGLTR